MIIKSLLLLAVLFSWSCQPRGYKQAGLLLSEANVLMEDGHYNLAKIKLDSVSRAFYNNEEIAGRAREMLREVNTREQEKSLAFLDSMLSVKLKTREMLSADFIVSIDGGGAVKTFTHRRQLPSNSFNRSFIKAHLDSNGNFFISSRYHGNTWIYHDRIRAYFRDKSVTSLQVPEDGVNNRRFEDGSNKWEVINLRDGTDNGVIDFIAANWQHPVRIQFMGRDHHFIILEQFDREAIRDGYELSFIIREINKINEEIEKTRRLIAYLRLNRG